MSTDFKIRTPEKNFAKDVNNLLNKTNGDTQGDKELTTAFRDLHVSALSKAVSISPVVTSVTLGIGPVKETNGKTYNDAAQEKEESSSCLNLHSSTPEKSKSRNLVNIKEFIRVKQKLEKLSPIDGEKKIVSENGFSHQKLLNEFDTQRKLTVDKVMRERIQNMYDTNKLIRDSLEHLKQTKQEEVIAKRLLLERKILDDIHEQEILNKPKREAEWAKVNLKEAQRIRERNQRVKEAEEEARKKSESILLKRKQIDQILFYLHKEYSQEHKAMLETIKSCKDKAALNEFHASHSKALKACTGVCEKLNKKCKQGDVNEEDVESAKNLVANIKIIREEFVKEINKIHEEMNAKKEESLKKSDVEQVTTQEATKSNSESTSSTTTQGSGKPDLSKSKSLIKPQDAVKATDETLITLNAISNLSDCFDPKSLEVYINLKSLLEDCEKTLEPLLADDTTKKFRFGCQKAVNIPVNAISPVSGPHLSDKYLKLQYLLSGRPVEVGDIKIAATQHPLGITYCKYLLAKKFVRQGDLTVSSKPDAAFSIAAVLASLWVDFPDFGQLVLAHFQFACPYLAPVFMPQIEGQTDEEYHKSLGYHYSQSGEVEKQDSFLKRMSGIMRLYAALLISNVRQPGKMNPLGLSEGWRWISSLLNLEPRPDICATLLYDFLEVAGNEMFRAYGGQFKKLLAYICQEYFPKLERVTPSSAGGPLVRLEGFLQKILKEESIPPAHGVLPPNFW